MLVYVVAFMESDIFGLFLICRILTDFFFVGALLAVYVLREHLPPPDSLTLLCSVYRVPISTWLVVFQRLGFELLMG